MLKVRVVCVRACVRVCSVCVQFVRVSLALSLCTVEGSFCHHYYDLDLDIHFFFSSFGAFVLFYFVL